MNRRDTLKAVGALSLLGFTGLAEASEKSDFSDQEIEQILAEVDVIINETHTYQATYEEVVEAVNAIWKSVGDSNPTVHLMDSPIACKSAIKAEEEGEFTPYWSVSFLAYSAQYQAMQKHGVEFDQEQLDLFVKWAKCCPFVLFKDDTVYVSKRPVIMKINPKDSKKLYCEYADGWKVDSRDGYKKT